LKRQAKKNKKTLFLYLSIGPFELQQDAVIEPDVLVMSSWSEGQTSDGDAGRERRSLTMIDVDAGGIGDGLGIDARACVADGDEASHVFAESKAL